MLLQHSVVHRASTHRSSCSSRNVFGNFVSARGTAIFLLVSAHSLHHCGSIHFPTSSSISQPDIPTVPTPPSIYLQVSRSNLQSLACFCYFWCCAACCLPLILCLVTHIFHLCTHFRGRDITFFWPSGCTQASLQLRTWRAADSLRSSAQTEASDLPSIAVPMAGIVPCGA